MYFWPVDLSGLLSRAGLLVASGTDHGRLPARWLPVCLILKSQMQLKSFFFREQVFQSQAHMVISAPGLCNRPGSRAKQMERSVR